jgi:hypothetical protein
MSVEEMDVEVDGNRRRLQALHRVSFAESIPDGCWAKRLQMQLSRFSAANANK